MAPRGDKCGRSGPEPSPPQGELPAPHGICRANPVPDASRHWARRGASRTLDWRPCSSASANACQKRRCAAPSAKAHAIAGRSGGSATPVPSAGPATICWSACWPKKTPLRPVLPQAHLPAKPLNRNYFEAKLQAVLRQARPARLTRFLTARKRGLAARERLRRRGLLVQLAHGPGGGTARCRPE